MTKNTIRKEQTGHAISEAQLPEISTTPVQDRLAEITTQTVREVLFSALQHAPIKETGHAYADITLRQAASIAALKAREAVHPAVSCNITASRLHRHITESTDVNGCTATHPSSKPQDRGSGTSAKPS